MLTDSFMCPNSLLEAEQLKKEHDQFMIAIEVRFLAVCVCTIEVRFLAIVCVCAIEVRCLVVCVCAIEVRCSVVVCACAIEVGCLVIVCV